MSRGNGRHFIQTDFLTTRKNIGIKSRMDIMHFYIIPELSLIFLIIPAILFIIDVNF